MSLANYLSSDEGKKHFDFRNMSRPQVLATLNEECGTDIKDDTFYRACRVCDLAFLNNAAVFFAVRVIAYPHK